MFVNQDTVQKLERWAQGEIITLRTAFGLDMPDAAACAACGLDIIPHSPACDVNQLFFVERVMGMQIHHEGGRQDFFHSLPVRCVYGLEDIGKLNQDPAKSPLWRDYMNRLANRQDDLPVSMIYYAPLDAACSLAGHEAVFLSLAEEDGFAEALLDAIENTMFRMADAFVAAFGTPVSGGFPGIYISDLTPINLSSRMLREKIYPYYARLAARYGAHISVASPDEAAFRAICDMDGVVMVSADARIPFETIDRCLKPGMVLGLSENEHLPDVEGPTLVDGMYVNPVVCAHDQDLAEGWQILGGKHSMSLHVDRRRFADALAVLNQTR